MAMNERTKKVSSLLNYYSINESEAKKTLKNQVLWKNPKKIYEQWKNIFSQIYRSMQGP